MKKIQLAEQDDLTRTIADRILEMWEAYKRIDAPAHNEILADAYTAVHPDGSVHTRAPTPAEIDAEPIEDFMLTDVRAVPLGPDIALVNYNADVAAKFKGSTSHANIVVGEIWLKRGGIWKCRYYQATLMK